MKTFQEDQPVEFIRDTDHGRPWEPGVYVRSVPEISRGWHEVRVSGGFDRFVIPARRIREPRP